jgi:hypothetical protein
MRITNRIRENVPKRLTDAAEKFDMYAYDLGSHIKRTFDNKVLDKNINEDSTEKLEKDADLYNAGVIGSMMATFYALALFPPSSPFTIASFVYCANKNVNRKKEMERREQ